MPGVGLAYSDLPSGWLNDWRIVQTRKVVLRSNVSPDQTDEWKRAKRGAIIQRGYVHHLNGATWKTVITKRDHEEG